MFKNDGKDFEVNGKDVGGGPDCYYGRVDKRIKSAKCDVRLTREENRMLNQLADSNGESRGSVMRKALRDFYKFNTEE